MNKIPQEVEKIGNHVIYQIFVDEYNTFLFALKDNKQDFFCFVPVVNDFDNQLNRLKEYIKDDKWHEIPEGYKKAWLMNQM